MTEPGSEFQAAAKSRFWRALRAIAMMIVLGSAVYVAVTTDLLGSLRTVGQLDPSMVVVASAATLATIVNRGFLNQASRSLHGVDQPLEREIRMSAASLALNKVVKSGGLVGLALYIRCGRRDGAPTGPVTRAFVVVGAGAQVAMVGLVGLALVISPRDQIPLAGQLSDAVIGGVGAGVLAMVAAVFVVGVVTAASPHGRVRRVTHAGRILAHAGANKVLGVAVLLASLDAAGADVGLRTAVLVYATALVSSALSIIPAGVGVVEASTVAMLTASGVDAGVAVVAILAFRLFDLWIPVFVGWLLARRLDRTADAKPATERTPLPIPSLVPIPATVPVGR